MQLEAANAVGNQPVCYADRIEPARGVYAGERQHDIGVGRRQRGDLLVRHLWPAGEPLIHGKYNATDFAGPVIFGNLLRCRAGARLPEVFACGLIGGIVGVRFNMDVSVDGNQVLRLHRKQLL